MPHNTFIFPDPPTYGWYLSVTAIFLNMSWSLHNVVAWMKNKPFLSRKASLFYIGTVILAQPYWVRNSEVNDFGMIPSSSRRIGISVAARPVNFRVSLRSMLLCPLELLGSRLHHLSFGHLLTSLFNFRSLRYMPTSPTSTISTICSTIPGHMRLCFGARCLPACCKLQH